MPETVVDEFYRRQAARAREPDPRSRRRHRGRGRRWARRAAAGGLVLVLIAGLSAAGGYLLAAHLAGSIRRIPGIAALTAAHQPEMPAATSHSMTVLLTGTHALPAGGAGRRSPLSPSGLIALVHLNADGSGGGVVSIPPNAVVSLPGHGRGELWDALALGGPSLLIRTVERLTGVRIDHYSVLDLAGATAVVRALNGVSVDVPYRVTSGGYTFPAGVNRLTGASMLAYVRQPGVSEIGRVLLQQNLIRAILGKISSLRLFSQVTTDYRVLRALTGALSVDSSFSNGELESLALRLGRLDRGAGVFLTAPAAVGSATAGGTSPVRLDQRVAGGLWQAIRHDSLTAFALRHPAAVTPGAPG